MGGETGLECNWIAISDGRNEEYALFPNPGDEHHARFFVRFATKGVNLTML